MRLSEFRPLHVRVERPSGASAASFAVGRDGVEVIEATPEGVLVVIAQRGEYPAERYLITPAGWGVPAPERAAVAAQAVRAAPAERRQ